MHLFTTHIHAPNLILSKILYAPGDEEALLAELRVSCEVPPDLASAVTKRKLDFVAGRLCAQRAIQTLNVAAVLPLPVTTQRTPLWPPDVRGSITHTRGYAAALVGRIPPYTLIGVDVEAIVKRADPALVKRIFQEAEWAAMLDSGLDPAILFTLGFSVKESLYKALYPEVRTYFGFEKAWVDGIDSQICTARVTLTTDLSSNFSTGTVFKARWEQSPGHMLTYISG